MLKRLTKEELQIITDALLFTSCTDITADFNDTTYLDRMVDVAKKLKGNPSKRLTLYTGGISEEPERMERIGREFLIKNEK